MEKKLQRIPHEGAVAGVCAGLGEYFGVDKTWVRLAFIVSVFFSGYMGIGLLGPIVYIVLWIVLPIKSFVISQDPFDVDYRAQESQPSAARESHNERYNPYAWSASARPNVSAARGSKDRYIAGLILLVVGLFFLLHQLDVIYWRDFARYWPVLIIFIGLGTIFGAFKSRKRSAFPVDETDAKSTGPAADQPDDNEGEEHSYTK